MTKNDVYDVISGSFGDFRKLGIVDAAKVLEQSILSAVDIACQVLRVGGDVRESDGGNGEVK